MSPEQLAKTATLVSEEIKPSLIFVTDCYRTALDRLNKTFTNGQSLATLIGEDEFGAGFVIGSFLDGIDENVDVARMSGTNPDAVCGFRELVQGFGIDSTDLDHSDLVDVTRIFLSLQKMRGRSTIVYIEAAQDNGLWVIDEVYRLVELERAGSFGLFVILSGRPRLDQPLSDRLSTTLPENAVQCITLAPFSLEETSEYVRWRIETGDDGDVVQLFEPNAIRLLHEVSAGVPDRVNEMCTSCLQYAESSGTALVTLADVNHAIELPEPTNKVKAPRVNGAAHAHGRLIVRINGSVVQERPLDREHILIGRHEHCDIRLANGAVSRRHAKLDLSPYGVTLSDLGSSNGTFVNGQEIMRHVLQENDAIEIGQCQLEYVPGDDSHA